jgi:hypothetical protein
MQESLKLGVLRQLSGQSTNRRSSGRTHFVAEGGSPGRQLAALFVRLSETEEKLCPTGKPFLFQLSQLFF